MPLPLSLVARAPVFDISQTFGAAFIGGMIALALYGITTLQTYLYYVYYPKDSRGFKVLVATIWVLETLQVAFVCHALYFYLVVNFADPLSLAVGVWSIYASLLCNVLIATIVQIFFAVRVHILGKKWWLTVGIGAFIAAHFAFGMETVIDMINLKLLTKLPTITWNVALPFAIMAVVPDIAIAASLCYFLNNGKGGFKGTNALINSLIIYAINRCLLTSLVASAELIVFATMPTTFFFLAIDFCIGKLYANSLLATLNTRQALRGRGFDSETYSGSLPTASSNSNSNGIPHFRNGQGARRHGEVNVQLSNLQTTWPSTIGTGKTSSETGVASRTDVERGASVKDFIDMTVDSSDRL